MILARRAMKARKNSRCPLCRGPVTIGQHLVQLGKTWVHTTCAVERIRRNRAAERENT